jgi:hypothetical protein
MQRLCWLVFLSGAYPIWRAWLANRNTSLLHAVTWAGAAWVAWGGTILVGVATWASSDTEPGSYVALCLTGCAGVAVLGARRPGVGAWNFVLLGLLAVMLLPLAERLLAKAASVDLLRVIFLAGTLAVVVLNYLPTCLAAAALVLGAGCALELLRLAGQVEVDPLFGWWLLALVPWVGLAGWRLRAANLAEFDAVWLDFRDRFGFLWGQRVREQFNRSAANANWRVILRWQGLRLLPGSALPDPRTQDAIVAALRALLKRFGAESE